MVAAGLSYRESGPADGPVALLLHGYPESSFMWSGVMPAIAGAGWRALAPDFAGFGDSPPEPPGTWERHVESVERFRRELGIERCVPVMHDWGGLIGMRWACEHPEAVRALVISSTGFFPDGKWHGMAKALREPGTGEQLMGRIDRSGFAAVMRQSSSGIDDEAIAEYWKGYADETRRRGQHEL
jgi:haloalkane dehalogenase